MRRVSIALLVSVVAAGMIPATSGAQTSLLSGKHIYQPDSNVVRINLVPPQPNTFWLIVASRPTQEEAVDLARSYSATIGPNLSC